MAKKPTQRQEKQKLVEVKRRLGENLDGSARYVSFYGKTKREALDKYDAAKKELFATELLGDGAVSNVSFEERAKLWLSKSKYGAVRDTTYAYSYQYPTEKTLIPYFGKWRIRDIKKSDIQEFFNLNKQRSYSWLHKRKICLIGIFDSAIEDGIVQQNPAWRIKIPKQSTDVQTERPFYTYYQSRYMIEYAKTHRFGFDAICLIKTGMRESELLAMFKNYKDNILGGVEHTNKFFAVRQSISESIYGLDVNPCKNKKSIREIPFDDELSSFIEQQCTASKGDYLISTKKGNHYWPQNWRNRRFNVFMRDFAVHCEAEGTTLPTLTPRQLRYSFGSILYSCHVDITTISKLMGHSSTHITSKIYVQDDMTLKRAAIDKAFGSKPSLR